MSVEEKMSAEIDSAIEEIQEDVAAEQTESENQGQSDTSGKDGDLRDQESGESEVSLETGDSENEETPADADAEKEDGESDEEESGSGDKPEPISNDVIARAVRAGFSIEEANSFESSEVLSRVVGSIELLNKANEPKEASPAKEEQTKEKGVLEDLPKLDPEVYGEEAVQMFDRLTEVIKSQSESINQFRAQQEDTARATADGRAQEAEQWFDGQVEKLGDDFTDALGTGRYGSLQQGSPQQAKREAIANQVAVMLAGYEKIGQEVPPRDEIFDTAAKLVLMDEFQDVRKQQLTKDLKARSGQHIQRASGRQAKTTQSPEDEVAAMIDAKFY